MMKLSDLKLDKQQQSRITSIVKTWMDSRKQVMTRDRANALANEFFAFVNRLGEGETKIREIEKKRKEGVATEEQLSLHEKLFEWYQALLMLVSFMYQYLAVYLPEPMFEKVRNTVFGS